MYAYESSPRKGMCHILTAGCFVTAFLMLGISGIEGLSYPSLYQLTSLVLLTAGTYLMVRYILKLYRYELEDSGIVDADGLPKYDLVITEITGRRRRVVTRVSVRDIETVVCLDGKKDKAVAVALIGDIKRVYRYTNDPFQKQGIYLVVPEEQSILVLPRDDNMLRYLRQFINQGEQT